MDAPVPLTSDLGGDEGAHNLAQPGFRVISEVFTLVPLCPRVVLSRKFGLTVTSLVSAGVSLG